MMYVQRAHRRHLGAGRCVLPELPVPRTPSLEAHPGESTSSGTGPYFDGCGLELHLYLV